MQHIYSVDRTPHLSLFNTSNLLQKAKFALTATSVLALSILVNRVYGSTGSSVNQQALVNPCCYVEGPCRLMQGFQLLAAGQLPRSMPLNFLSNHWQTEHQRFLSRVDLERTSCWKSGVDTSLGLD